MSTYTSLQALDSATLSAALKPRLRKKIDELGKRASMEKKAAGQGAIDKAIAQVGRPA